MINEQYEEIVDPSYLIKYIKDFDAWLSLAKNKEELISCLIAFTEAELYEECEIIKNRIKLWEQD